MRYRLAFNRMASALRLAGSIYVSLNYLKVMKESNNKTSGHTQSGQSEWAEKSSRTTTSRTQLGEPGNRKQPVVRFRAHFAQQQSRRP